MEPVFSLSRYLHYTVPDHRNHAGKIAPQEQKLIFEVQFCTSTVKNQFKQKRRKAFSFFVTHFRNRPARQSAKKKSGFSTGSYKIQFFQHTGNAILCTWRSDDIRNAFDIVLSVLHGNRDGCGF